MKCKIKCFKSSIRNNRNHLGCPVYELFDQRNTEVLCFSMIDKLSSVALCNLSTNMTQTKFDHYLKMRSIFSKKQNNLPR